MLACGREGEGLAANFRDPKLWRKFSDFTGMTYNNDNKTIGRRLWAARNVSHITGASSNSLEE